MEESDNDDFLKDLGENGERRVKYSFPTGHLLPRVTDEESRNDKVPADQTLSAADSAHAGNNSPQSNWQFITRLWQRNTPGE